jgi:ketosteroid isomerase-like protein
MSQENVNVVRESLEAFVSRDEATLRALNHADVEVDWTASLGVEARVYKGIEAVLGFYKGYFEAFQTIVFEQIRFIDAGRSVVVPNTSRSQGRDGIEVLARSALVFTVRDRRIAEVRLYQDTPQALEALDLDLDLDLEE